jgi:hypothetical protein
MFIKIDGNPWWHGLRNQAISLSFPLFLLFFASIIFCGVRAPHYGLALFMCAIVSQVTNKIPIEHKYAKFCYVSSFVVQVMCLVYGIVALG